MSSKYLLFYFSILSCLLFRLPAQPGREFNGVVYDSSTRTTLAQVIVSVRRTSIREKTNAQGQYVIIAQNRDTLDLNLPGYRHQEIIVKEEALDIIEMKRDIVPDPESPM